MRCHRSERELSLMLAPNSSNTYAGDTIVTGGTLNLGAANANSQTFSCGLATGATLNSTDAVTDTVAKLFLCATLLAAGE